jgi:hypothetical protein
VNIPRTKEINGMAEIPIAIIDRNFNLPISLSVFLFVIDSVAKRIKRYTSSKSKNIIPSIFDSSMMLKNEKM